MTGNTHRADIVAVMGASGSGKSSAVIELLHGDEGPRRVIYDPKGEYAAFGEVFSDLRLVSRAVVAAGAGPFRIVFSPTFDMERARVEFGLLCELAHATGDVLLVADELEDVMLPNWAPAGWRMLIRRGRSRGCRILAASQVPAGIEKRFWDQATVIRSGRLNGYDSAVTVARVLMVEPAELVALAPMRWIQRSVYRPVIQRGRLEWRRGRPVSVVTSDNPLPGLPSVKSV